jgi:hypothetical protein
MLLSQPLQAFVDDSPVSVMVAAIVERLYDPAALEKLFQDNAVLQYTKELTFAQTLQVMSDVVCRVTPSVGQVEAHRIASRRSTGALFG